MGIPEDPIPPSLRDDERHPPYTILKGPGEKAMEAFINMTKDDEYRVEATPHNIDKLKQALKRSRNIPSDIKPRVISEALDRHLIGLPDGEISRTLLLYTVAELEGKTDARGLLPSSDTIIEAMQGVADCYDRLFIGRGRG